MLKEIAIISNKRLDMIDISGEVERAVNDSKIKDGICTIFIPHATAAIIINENYDPNICEDFSDALKKLIPQGEWRHDQVDGNADAHIKAAICGPSETIPIKDGKLQLGRWQAIMAADFDGPRQRKGIIHIRGD